MLTVVTGPPCSGKSTYIRERAKPGDIVIDMDRIALAIAPEHTEHHTYPPHLRAVARAARNAAATTAIKTHQGKHNVWIIDTAPGREARAYYHRHHAHIHTMTTSRTVCLERAATQRPATITPLIHDWFDNQPITGQGAPL